MVEDMTSRLMDMTPPLIPNGSHWRLPDPDWVQQQQQAAKQQVKSVPLWKRIIQAPSKFLGLVDDSFQGPQELLQGEHLFEHIYIDSKVFRAKLGKDSLLRWRCTLVQVWVLARDQ